MTTDKLLILNQFTDEELKDEILRRRTLERARKHLPSAQAALERAKEKVDRYIKAVKEADRVRARR